MITTIKLFYILYTIYTIYIALISDYRYEYVCMGLLNIWIIYFFYVMGFNSIKEKRTIRGNCNRKYNYFLFSIDNWKRWQFAGNVLLCFVFSILGSWFYTGMTPIDLATHFREGTSIYYAYQQYFQQNELKTFSIQKVPAILMFFYVIINFYMAALQIIRKNKLRPLLFVYVLLIMFSFEYIGIARGTNFESYLIFVAFSYCLINYEGTRVNWKNLVITFGLGLLLVLLFENIVLNRGIVFYNKICDGILHDADSFLSVVLPTITHLAIIIFGYLGFGIYVIGYSLYEIVFDNWSLLLGSLLPSGLGLVTNTDFISIVRTATQVGVKWVPDYMYFLDRFGFPLFWLLIYFLGKLTVIIRNSEMPELQIRFATFFITLEMLSIPVGSFITTSSAHILCVLYIAFYLSKYYLLTLSNR